MPQAVPSLTDVATQAAFSSQRGSVQSLVATFEFLHGDPAPCGCRTHRPFRQWGRVHAVLPGRAAQS